MSDEYKVKGYNERNPEYDGEYLNSIDPEFVFAYAGDPEKQEKYQNDLKELAGVKDDEVKYVEVDSEGKPLKKEQKPEHPETPKSEGSDDTVKESVPTDLVDPPKDNGEAKTPKPDKTFKVN